jgi:hypothetical protein|tara:strand:- start:1564 stop:1833 length:270 start_codon:yes stop_codon:yes gene_type:complete
MKIRNKNVKEKQYDQLQIDQARRDLADVAVNFIQQFNSCDGEVFYSLYKDFENKAWEYEREKENGAMKKVGEDWDWENKVCGEYRYRDI